MRVNGSGAGANAGRASVLPSLRCRVRPSAQLSRTDLHRRSGGWPDGRRAGTGSAAGLPNTRLLHHISRTGAQRHGTLPAANRSPDPTGAVSGAGARRAGGSTVAVAAGGAAIAPHRRTDPPPYSRPATAVPPRALSVDDFAPRVIPRTRRYRIRRCTIGAPSATADRRATLLRPGRAPRPMLRAG